MVLKVLRHSVWQMIVKFKLWVPSKGQFKGTARREWQSKDEAADVTVRPFVKDPRRIKGSTLRATQKTSQLHSRASSHFCSRAGSEGLILKIFVDMAFV